MVPIAHIEHQLPGRVRLRVPSKRGDVSYFERAVKELSRHPAVWELIASPLTGTITLQYSEPLQAIVDAAAKLILFEMGAPKPGVRAGESKRAVRLTRNAGLAGHVAVGLSGLSLFQVGRGNVVGNAVENFWLAFNAQAMLGRTDLAAAFAVVGVWQMLSGRLLGSATSLFFYSMVMRQMAAMEEARAHARTVTSRPVKTAN
jgi:hypothetical protein